LLSCALLLSACSSRPYLPDTSGSPAFIERSLAQDEEGIRISVAVPDATESEQFFGLPLYDKDVQPVWLSVENNTDTSLRLSIWSIDPDYYPPLEVAWMFRGDFSKEDRAGIEETLYQSAIARRIPAGQSRSGFVFSRFKPGTKGFNVDIFEPEGESHHFTFFVPMPGFVPDYMTVDFASLYSEEEILHTDEAGLREALEQLPCCATDSTGTRAGTPYNVMLVGTGEAVRRALLRADWQETEDGSKVNALASRQFYFGRKPDGNFIKARSDGNERRELRLWLAPIKLDEKWVWVGQTVNVISESIGKSREPFVGGNIDTPATYLMQDFWYHQSLESLAFYKSMEEIPAEERVGTFDEHYYYTQGYPGVLILSEDPVGLDRVFNLQWEDMPVAE